jgi:hypothetical protein
MEPSNSPHPDTGSPSLRFTTDGTSTVHNLTLPKPTLANMLSRFPLLVLLPMEAQAASVARDVPPPTSFRGCLFGHSLCKNGGN